MQLKILLRCGSRLGLGVAQCAVGPVGQRIHAERAARADADRLQRVIADGLLAGVFPCTGAKIHVKRRMGLGGGLGGKRCLGHSRCHGGRVGGLPLRGGRSLLRETARVRDDVVNRMVRAAAVRQRTGQILDALLLGLLLKQAGVVGGLGCGALLALGLQDLVLAVYKQNDVRGGDGKEEHQPQQEDEQHDNVGGGTPEQRQQRGTDGRTEDAALPEVGAAAGKEHLDDLPDLEVLNIELGEDDRHAGAEHAHQRYLARKQRDAVAGGQQVGQVQQERSDQIGRDTENAKVPAAQRAPKILPGHKHERNAKQTQPHQQDAAGQVRGLRAALGTAGRLTAAGGRTAARGCGAPGAAAARAPGGGGAFFAGEVLC